MGFLGTHATILFYCVALSIVTAGFATSSNSGHIARETLQLGAKSSRMLVEQPKLPPRPPSDLEPCHVHFDKMSNFTSLWKTCRPNPRMKPADCCKVFKSWACPFQVLMNNNKSACADDMFYQMMVVGDLPSEIFMDLCVDGPQGMAC